MTTTLNNFSAMAICLTCCTVLFASGHQNQLATTVSNNYKNYVVTEENKALAEKRQGEQRLEQVKQTSESWSRNVNQNNNSKKLAAKRNNQLSSSPISNDEQREINNSALLSVYDTNNNGILDPPEKKQFIIDQQRLAIDITILSRWEAMIDKIRSNNKLPNEQKQRLIEKIQSKINTASQKTNKGENENE